MRQLAFLFLDGKDAGMDLDGHKNSKGCIRRPLLAGDVYRNRTYRMERRTRSWREDARGSMSQFPRCRHV
jgi:hypothetical protein